LLQLLLSLLAVINIDEEVEPSEDAPISVSYGQSHDIEPAVHAVKAAVATLDVVSSFGFVGFHLCRGRALKVIRVNDVRSLPTFQLFKGLAEVLEGRSIKASTSPDGVVTATGTGMLFTIKLKLRSTTSYLINTFKPFWACELCKLA
jgi:hypothetical protein